MARAKGDYAARRADVAEATWRVIGREGLAGASMRKIAAELDMTTGVLAHYFADKDDIVMFAMQEFYDRLMTMMSQAAADHADPKDRLRAAVTRPLPTDDMRRAGWRILLSFMSHSLGSGKLRLTYRQMYANLIDLVADLIAGAVPKGAKFDRATIEEEAKRLVAVVDGVGFSVIVHPTEVPDHVLLPVVDHYIDNVLLPRLRLKRP